jgi:hypothetical protein
MDKPVEHAPLLSRAADAGKPATPPHMKTWDPSQHPVAPRSPIDQFSSSLEPKTAQVTAAQRIESRPRISAERGKDSPPHETPVRHPSARNLESPRLSAQPAVRTPIEPRMKASSPVGSLNGGSPFPPDIQITIGTVEVRAVLPEKPATRTPSRRPNPSLSLDEYLKRPRREAQ